MKSLSKRIVIRANYKKQTLFQLLSNLPTFMRKDVITILVTREDCVTIRGIADGHGQRLRDNRMDS